MMAESRYSFSKKIKDGQLITAADTFKINVAIRYGQVPYETIILEQGQRLDHIAGAAYGDGTLWWIIAAASGIGWGMQCPPGTIIKIPINPTDAYGAIL